MTRSSSGSLTSSSRAIDKRLPRLTIRLASSAPADSKVSRDGVVLGPASLGVAAALNPGPHRIVVTAAGRVDAEFDVTLTEGAAQEIEVHPGAPLAQEATAVAASPPRTEDAERSSDAEASPSARTLLTYGAFGLGGVGIAVGIGSGSRRIEARRSRGRVSARQLSFFGAERHRQLSFVEDVVDRRVRGRHRGSRGRGGALAHRAKTRAENQPRATRLPSLDRPCVGRRCGGVLGAAASASGIVGRPCVGLSACPAFLSDNFAVSVDAGQSMRVAENMMPPSSKAEPRDRRVTAGPTDLADSAPDASDAGFDASGLVALTLTVTTYGPASVSASSLPSGVSCSTPSCSQQVAYFAPGSFSPTERFAVGGDARSLDGRLYDRGPFVRGHHERPAIGHLDRQRVELRLLDVDAVERCARRPSGSRWAVPGCWRPPRELPGTYRAWLSTSSVNAIDRVAGARGWIRVDGAPSSIRLEGRFFIRSISTSWGTRRWSPRGLGRTARERRDGCGICSEWTSGDAGADWTCQGPRVLDDRRMERRNGRDGLRLPRLDLLFWRRPQALRSRSRRVAGRYAFLTKSTWDPASGIG